MRRLLFYTVFHLNLAYSSIEEEQRPKIMRRCYWPLLHLAREYNMPFGIEASGYTLETAAAIDPTWLDELRHLTTKGPCEFIGSGYAQIIGPLAPTEVNAANLRLGYQIYERLLGLHPQIALVNEQAYSSGLVQHYLDAGYKAIIMEWDNPYRYHPGWSPEWRYLPQFACGQHGEDIPLIWNKSIAFQKFQRYAHNEIGLDEYLDYLCLHLSETPRAFPLYGNDIEIFDFRPGRYHTEAVLQEEEEWQRIERLFEALLADGRFQFIRPSQALELMQAPGAGNRLHLESPEQPIPVKKQGKYNITRWAVTGRDDLGINTACWRIYEALKANPDASDDDWKELCYLWSSDFRTHITEKRWKAFRERLASFQQRVGVQISSMAGDSVENLQYSGGLAGDAPIIQREGRYLTIETASVRVRFNCRRGLAIDGLWLDSLEGPPLCGTLPHGYYDDIALGADWYTGHMILETPGQSKVTDLNPVEPTIEVIGNTKAVVVRGTVPTRLGPVVKRIIVLASKPALEISYAFEWDAVPIGSFRLGNVTLNPKSFDRLTLRYRTHNGGRDMESFPLTGKAVKQGEAISFLVSASHGMGLTNGVVELGDAERCLRVEVDKSKAALIGLLTCREIGDSYFFRLALSAGEMDETRRAAGADCSRQVVRLIIRLCQVAEG